MSRSAHSRRLGRCRPTSPHQVFLVGVLTCDQDFEQARPWGLSAARDYESYLLDTAVLLEQAHRSFEAVQVRRFHPADFAEFCLLHRLDPTARAAQERYLANPALLTQLLVYQGEELTGDFVPRLIRARENGLTMRHAELLLSESGPDPRIQRAYQEAAELFRRLLRTAGPGTYEVRCEVLAPGGPLPADARVVQWEDGVVRINDEDLDLVHAVLCAALAGSLPGTLTLAGLRGSAAGCGEYQPVRWDWASTGAGFTPVR